MRHILSFLLILILFWMSLHAQCEKDEWFYEPYFGEYICSDVEYEIFSIVFLFDSTGYFNFNNGDKETFFIKEAYNNIVIISYKDTIYCLDRSFAFLNFNGFRFIRRKGYDENQNLIYTAPIKTFQNKKSRYVHGRTKRIRRHDDSKQKCITRTRYRKNQREGLSYSRCGLKIVGKGRYKNDLSHGKFYVDLGRKVEVSWFENGNRVKKKLRYKKR